MPAKENAFSLSIAQTYKALSIMPASVQAWLNTEQFKFFSVYLYFLSLNDVYGLIEQ